MATGPTAMLGARTTLPEARNGTRIVASPPVMVGGKSCAPEGIVVAPIEPAATEVSAGGKSSAPEAIVPPVIVKLPAVTVGAKSCAPDGMVAPRASAGRAPRWR
jgi:hypothetical protein